MADFQLTVKKGTEGKSAWKYRAVGRTENLGVPVLFCGHNPSALVEIGLNDLPKSGDAMAPPAPPRDDRTDTISSK